MEVVLRTAHERGEDCRIGQREKFNDDTAAAELGWIFRVAGRPN